MNRKWCGNKRPWPNLRHYSEVGMRKRKKILSQYIQCSGRGSNWSPSEALQLRPKNSVTSAEIKQRPVKMGGRTTYRTLPPQRAPFQNGVDRWPNLWKVPRRTATHILCDCEAIANLRFRHLGQFFMDPSDYYDAPIYKVLHFIEV
jgi:hypothetical protein